MENQNQKHIAKSLLNLARETINGNMGKLFVTEAKYMIDPYLTVERIKELLMFYYPQLQVSVFNEQIILIHFKNDFTK
jgi:hypothetical protein